MEEQKPGSRIGDSMMFGLIEHAERIEESMAETHRVLTERIKELGQLQAWAVQTSVDLQKRADAALKNLEAERVRLQGTQMNLERNAVQALHDAVEKQSGKIERQVEQALATQLGDIKRAAAQVGQNIKETNWLFAVSVFLLGLVGGLAFGYFAVMRTQNALDDRLDRIEQFFSTPVQPVPAAPDPHVPARKGKAK